MAPYALAFLLFVASACAADWPQFRGLTGVGYSDERDLPLTWNAKTGEGIAWRAALPKSDNAWSSPIVSRGRVFVIPSARLKQAAQRRAAKGHPCLEPH